MNTRSSTKTSLTQFEIQNLNSPEKPRNSDSPTSSILKTPTAIFVSTRSSSTKRLKFANGPVDLQNLKRSPREPIADTDSELENPESLGDSNGGGEVNLDESKIEVALSPAKTMQVSPESWNAFLEYKKYHDYPNETEKTDYTYSRLSKFRHKEIIPGFLIRPNLSRSSISSSRKSSVYLPGNQSSVNESSILSYDFKVHSSPEAERNYELKTSTAINNNKNSRSKYYLRSSTFEDASIGEIESKPVYFEREYLSDSGPDQINRKSSSIHRERGSGGGGSEITSSSMVKSDYLKKVRPLDLDDDGDEEIDEIDDGTGRKDHPRMMDYDSSSSSSSASRWLRYGQTEMKNLSSYFTNFFAAAFLCLTAAGEQTKNLFSKHVLRREDHRLKEDGLSYSGVGGSNLSWTNEKPYTSDYYYSGGYYGRNQGSWYQTVSSYFQDRISQISNLVLGVKETTRYSPYGYQQTSKKKKFWWFLIPLLIFTGFWLYRGDQKYGIISGQYKALDCSTNGFLTSTENGIKSIWKWIYFSWKRASASASCYANDSWERLKLPFAYAGDRFSGGLLHNLWSTFWLGTCNILTLFRDAFYYSGWFLIDFLGDLIGAMAGLFWHGCRLLKIVYSSIAGGFFDMLKSFALHFGSFLRLTTIDTREATKVIIGEEEPRSREYCSRQMEADPPCKDLTGDGEECRRVSWDLTEVKKKIAQLEMEIGRGKESMKNRNEFYDKQIEDNYLTLQKYKAEVNQALISSRGRGEGIDSQVLEDRSNDLKQWILDNFMLKTDSAAERMDESKIASLIAKHGNRSGEELISIGEKFKRILTDQKTELDSLRNELASLASTNIQGREVSPAYVKKLVRDAIKLYDADKTGRADYALETAGGQVQSIRCTETYIASPKSYILLGWAVYTKTSSPRDAISPGMAAGQCWAFVGSQGFLVLQLSHTIRVTGFTMEHISKSLVPRGHIESAPKNFSLWGLKSEFDVDPHLFGEYVYLDNEETLQYFPVLHPSSEKHNMVELKITSNHGNPNYTCLYRIRVHGDLNPEVQP